LKKALIKQALKDKEDECLKNLDDRQRNYNSMKEDEKLTEVDLEAYKLRKLHANDPMASYFKK